MFIRNFFKIRFKKFMKLPAVIPSLSFLIFIYTKFVGLSCRWRLENIDETLDKVSATNAVWVSWHSRATMMPYFWQKLFGRKMTALVSPHQDGQLIAHFLKFFGILPINGSTNQNPRQSALGLMRAMQNGYDLFIAPDGPRGPRMRMKRSPIYYAQKTGKPIICACFSTNRALIFDKAWDKMMIGLPFSKGVFALSEPLYIPDDISDEQLEEYRQKLENIANSLLDKCDRLVGRTPVLAADNDDYKKKKGLSDVSQNL